MEIKLSTKEYENLLKVYFTASLLVDPVCQAVKEPLTEALTEAVAEVNLTGDVTIVPTDKESNN